MYGQEPEATADSRGVVPADAAASIRAMRAAEMWTRYDTVMIGKGASLRSRGWFESWQDFANADQLEWFSGRDTAAGSAWVNQLTERTDWAQDLYQTRIEFVTPPGLGDLETDSNDALITPALFTQMFPSLIAIRVVLADSDEIMRAPATFYPAGLGPAYGALGAPAAQTTFGATNGEPHISNSFVWPSPIMLAAKAKLTVRGSIDAPLRAMLASLPGPGAKRIPIGNGQYYEMPNWYGIRISFWGPRYLQMRGARSSS
jgi:hypothetical protein